MVDHLASRCLALLALCALPALGESPTARRAFAPWDGPAFSARPADLLAAAGKLPIKDTWEAEVLLSSVEISIDDEGLWSERRHQVFRVVDPEAIDAWAVLESHFSPWYEERPVLKGRVITGDGREHWLDPATIAEGPLGVQSDVLFDDDLSVRAPLPAVEVGAVVETEVVKRQRQPFFASGTVHTEVFWEDAVRHARVVVEAPRSLPLAYRARLLPAFEQVDRLELDGRVRLTFEAFDLEPTFSFESGVPPQEPMVPTLAISTGESWNVVAANYSRLVDGALAGADLSREVAEAASGAAAQTEVIARLLAGLQKKVRYTGVEFGEASIVPRSPREIQERRFGDCKDKATYLVGLLRAADIPAYVALLQAGLGTDVEGELPGLGAFNHAIVYVPATPPIWIDATDEMSRAGELPISDQGRLALIAAPSSRQLVRTPEAQAGDNLETHRREFTLSDFGPARVVEEIEYHGEPERSARRSLGLADGKARQETFESYAENAFLSKKIGAPVLSAAGDLSRPFQVRLEVGDAKRGLTDLDEGVVGIRLEELLTDLPWELQLRAGADEGDEGDEEPRRRAYRFAEPMVRELRYLIHPAPGMAVRSLPPAETKALGSASLSRSYSARPDGAVEAVFRFDSGKRDLSAEEFEALAKALGEVLRAEPILLYFDQVSAAHLAAGRLREAAAELRRLAEQSPAKGLYHLQLSRVLLAAGLGTAAREEARRSIELAPDFAPAHNNLGWVLQHDEIGRRFGKGFDRTGAITAYRGSLRLDPEGAVPRADLAILLEYDERGERYAKGAELVEAEAEYRQARETLGATQLDTNLMINLAVQQRFEDLATFAGSLPESLDRLAFQVLAAAATQGGEAAARMVRGLDGSQRAEVFSLANQYLVRARRYGLAAELLRQAAGSSPNPADVLARGEMLARTRRWEEVELDSSDPRSVLPRLFLQLAGLDPKGSFSSLLSRRILEALPPDQRELSAEDARKIFAESGKSLPSEVPAEVLADVALSALTLSVEGREDLGFRVASSNSNLPSVDLTLYLVSENGEKRLLAGSGLWWPLGRLVLDLAEAGKLEDARQWLDWVREDLGPGGGGDTYDRRPFALLWSRGSAADLDTIRRAAAALILETEDASLTDTLDSPLSLALAVLAPPPESPLSSEQALALDLARVKALRRLERYDEVIPIAERLAEARPDSMTAFRWLCEAHRRARHHAEVERLSRARLETFQGDPGTTLLLAATLAEAGSSAPAEQLLRDLEARNKAGAAHLNQLAWMLLLQGKAGAEAVDFAQRSVQMSSGNNYGSLHTLASLYAALDRPAEAYRVILQAIEASESHEPGSSDWLVFGRVAETLGLVEQARAYYLRVEPPEDELGDAMSTAALAKRRLAALPPPAPAKKKGKAGLELSGNH